MIVVIIRAKLWSGTDCKKAKLQMCTVSSCNRHVCRKEDK
jgi:hypothetical protein